MKEPDSPGGRSEQDPRTEASSINISFTQLERLRARADMAEVLERRTARLETLLANTSCAVCILDGEGRFEYAGPQVKDLLGVTPEELDGSLLVDLAHPEDVIHLEEGLGATLAGRPLRYLRIRALHSAGHKVHLSICGQEALLDGVVRVVITLCDVSPLVESERRRVERELQPAQRLDAIGLLAGGIAHDFNNVLSAVLGNLNVARARCSRESSLDPLLADAERATLRARNLTQRLLTFSRGGEPIKRDVRVAPLLNAALREALPRDAPPPSLDLPDALWSIEADPEQVHQAFEHLARNALKASEGTSRMAVRAANVRIHSGNANLLPGRYVQVAFEDSGAPIPSDRPGDLFSSCAEEHGSSASSSASAILGLATAYSIAHRHGGALIRASVETGADTEEAPKEPSGNLLSIFLPANLSPTQEHALPKTMIAGEGRRILVMDDEEMVRNVARRMLVSLGFEVTLAADGQEAINLWQQARETGNPFHAVMLDLTVPNGVGGRDTIVRLLELDPDVRAIVASGYSFEGIMANYAEHGFKAVLPKPYQLSDLATALHRALA